MRGKETPERGSGLGDNRYFPTETILENTIDPREYIIGPGDEFAFNMLSSDGIVSLVLKISPTGEVLIPAVGVIFIDKMTLVNAFKEIKTKCLDKYGNAKINLSLKSLRQFKILIAGAVKYPGFYPVNTIDRLSDLVEKSGGFHQLAKEYNIMIQRSSGTTENINYINYILNGDLNENPQFIEGDQIFVPFGNIEEEAVAIRGSIKGNGYEMILEKESLQHLIRRKIEFSKNTDISNVVITRFEDDNMKIIFIAPNEFHLTILKPGDIIDFSENRSVMVNGFVKTPGKYKYSPGYVAADYIGIAGGNLIEGNAKKVIIYHKDGTQDMGQSILIQRGDIIVIPQTKVSLVIGKLSLLELTSVILTIYLTYLATKT